MSCEYCGCDCCDYEDEPEWDGVPKAPPKEGTPARVLFDYFNQTIAKRFNQDGLLFKRLYGK